MGKDRTITGFGPTALTLTHTPSTATASINSGWKKFGPFKANTIDMAMVFNAATSGTMAKLEGALTTASTQTWLTLDSHDGADATAVSRSTQVNILGYLRLSSTAKGTSTAVAYSVTAYFSAVSHGA
jgi:hypothetical protein